MIPLELTWAIVLYSAVLGALILAIWIYTAWRIYRPQRLLGKQFLWRCPFCGYVYLDEHGEALSQCPRCGSLCAADDKAGPDARARAAPAPAPASVAGTASRSSEPRKNASLRKRPHQRRKGPRKRA